MFYALLNVCLTTGNISKLASSITDNYKDKLKKPLFIHDPKTRLLSVNFDSDLPNFLESVKFLFSHMTTKTRRFHSRSTRTTLYTWSTSPHFRFWLTDTITQFHQLLTSAPNVPEPHWLRRQNTRTWYIRSRIGEQRFEGILRDRPHWCLEVIRAPQHDHIQHLRH